jgi:hypothetical protein
MKRSPEQSPLATKDQLAEKVAEIYGFNQNYLSLISKNSEYYFTRFYNLKAKRTILCWNWAGFILGPFWLIYRKMYSLGLILLILYTTPIYINAGLYKIITIAISVFVGAFGNKIYLNKIENIIVSAREGSDEWKTFYYKMHGGISYLAVIATIVVSCIVAFILGYSGIMPAFRSIPFLFDWY